MVTVSGVWRTGLTKMIRENKPWRTERMRLVDAENFSFDLSGLVSIPPNDYIGIAEYFAKQIRSLPEVKPRDSVCRECQEFDCFGCEFNK